MTKKQEFKVDNVELSGSNLIEASAGTGKTFSIAILVLRLILEKNIDVKKILMVTFTKAAVAELESRIRIFIRTAYRYVQNNDSKIDDHIKFIVDESIKKTNKQEIITRLKGASLNLDETAIFTIHSFCQKTLTEFAFETQQLFGSDVVNNQSDIVEKAINEYWRKSISTLDLSKIELLMQAGLSKADLKTVVLKGLSGKTFIYKNHLPLDEFFERIKNLNDQKGNTIKYFKKIFEHSEEKNLELIQAKRDKNYAIKGFAKLINNAEIFLDELILKKDKAYVKNCFPNLLAIALKISEIKEEEENVSKDILYYIYGNAIDKTKVFVEKTKHRLSLLTYDDLIFNLHKAVKGEQSDLLKYELQKKYKAVFIDEFQDTDKLQYEIFNALFGLSSILFYIGDPKQAIYSFRGADIDTYKQASRSTNQAFTMSQNFRSTPQLIHGLNHFFVSLQNPFLDTNINYEWVSNGKNIDELQFQKSSTKPISIIDCDNKKEIAKQVAIHVLDLLQNPYQIENRAVKPSDIGVLVRTKNEGRLIKNELNNLNIPSVTLDDLKVTDSPETKTVFYILKAILEPSIPNVNRAILCNLTNITKSDLLNQASDWHINQFKTILIEWQKKSVLSALSLFLNFYNVKFHLLEEDTKNGERIITNLFQIIELLHKKEMTEQLLPNELTAWFQHFIEGESIDEDEFAQRIESDEDAVKIVTIHKSKGLSYPIVLAPFLDLKSKPSNQSKVIEYKNEEQSPCFSMYKSEDEMPLFELQNEQENRRLVYVTLTRAVYKNYIFRNTNNTFGNGTISRFIESLDNVQKSEYIDQKPKITESPKVLFESVQNTNQKQARTFNRTIQKQWSVLSYSRLSDSHLSFSENRKGEWATPFDEFVFSKLQKGSITGNFLHEIFEKADFQNEDFEHLIKELGPKYSAIYNSESIGNYNLLVKQVLNARLPKEKFQLSEVTNANKLPELEFFFNFKSFNHQKIEALSQLVKVDPINIHEGLMYGFIDLFFKHNGKYYILDWKSNYLGSSVEDYQTEQLELAMTGNNYHLQYLIYTIAVKRFLSLKMPDFNYQRDFGGVFYVFLRACRESESTGVFFTKPDVKLIEQLDQLL